MDDKGSRLVKTNGHSESAMVARIDELSARLALEFPEKLAENTGAVYLELGQGRGEFHLEFLGLPILVTFPGFSAISLIDDAPITLINHALLLYYFVHSDGTGLRQKWISFSELPEGRIYSSAFQGYTGDELARTFGFNLSGFHSACRTAGGVQVNFGDAAYRFNPLPRLDLLVVYYLGDEDFPSSCKVLFAGNASHYLPAEACAILGGSLVKKIKKFAGTSTK
jgi:hypothetical protein